MTLKNIFYILLIFNALNFSNCFIALPFNTIFIKNNSVSPQNYFGAQLLQNEIYVNFTLGTPKQVITSILKMDVYGFYIFNGSFNKNLSSSYELIDNERRQNSLLQVNTFTSYDYFNIPTFNSFSEFNKYNSNGKSKFKNILKKERAEFLYTQKVKGSITYFNDVYEKYGIIGLKINSQRYYIPPEFVKTFKEIKDAKTNIFYLKFNNDKINGFVDCNNTGYFIIGEDLSDKESDKNKIKYTRARERIEQVNWDLAFDDLISKSKENDTIEYRPEYKHAELYVNFPYIVAPRDYEAFIRKVFFQKLLIEKVCYYTDRINGEEYSAYKCEGSELFLENLEKRFPDLIFEHEELEEKFIFTGKDLFTYNMYNKSDTNLYFMVLFPRNKDLFHPMNWYLGTPFFKKYILSFNYDNKMIGYLKQNDISSSENKFLAFKKEIIIAILFVFSVILAFTLGIYTHKRLSKGPRKSKANELDDDNFEYVNKNEINEEDNNDQNIEENKDINLKNKLIN